MAITREDLKKKLDEIHRYIFHPGYTDSGFQELDRSYRKMQREYMAETKDASYAQLLVIDDLNGIVEGECGTEPWWEYLAEEVSNIADILITCGFRNILDKYVNDSMDEQLIYPAKEDTWWVQIIKRMEADI